MRCNRASIALLMFVGILLSSVAYATEQEIYTMERSYYLISHIRGAVYDLQVNGLNVKKETNASPKSYSLPINHLMRTGENTITFNYAPIAGFDPETNQVISELHDTFFARIAIESMNLTTRERERERITLMDISYDSENNALQGNLKNPQGQEHVYETENLSTDGRVRQSNPHVIVNGIGTPLPTEPLTVSFTTPDRFPAFHWLDAVELEDTPQMRAELVAAYERMYSYIYNEEFDSFFQELEPVWRQGAITTGVGQTAMDYVERMAIEERIVPVRPDGRTLNPLKIPDNLDHHVEFMGEGRLVRILPHPVTWQYPDSERYSAMPLLFYKTPSREWKVADILTD
ncbi:hypothetical protein [Nitrincola iocasae]|uniref:Uncharacterized protein n=1 Tax=Nitrincola iocasae TaxID=2614693 RepID=A0A5J6LC01_9GAMM|nr:hypothetical protein [Nitrincola iocasae]QEW05732.1 hypothetical protein F5I99_04090 [Nitrincola iocasae]